MALRLTGPAPQGPPARKLAEAEPPRHPSPGGMKPAGRPAASGPLDNEPRCPTGPSWRCIPAGFIAASSGFVRRSKGSHMELITTPYGAVPSGDVIGPRLLQ